MERIKNLNQYQKAILLILSIMPIIFIICYSVIVSQEGFLYKKAILIPYEENGSTIYSGKIKRKQAIFTVSKDKVVSFQYDDRLYGPYVAKEDMSAVPEDIEWAEDMTGVELRCGEKIIFRGGIMEHGNERWLYNEDGSFVHNIVVTGAVSNGTELDSSGNVIDPMEPSISDIIDLMSEPELTKKGDWTAWFYGTFVCIATAISMLYADEIFRWNLSFQIRNTKKAEPSDWEIASRYISWTLLTVFALILFVVGLQ